MREAVGHPTLEAELLRGLNRVKPPSKLTLSSVCGFCDAMISGNTLTFRGRQRSRFR
jgi:hypothetical protein